MINKTSISNQQIINCLKRDYGIEVSLLTLLTIGADMDASLYKAETREKEKYFLKLRPSQDHNISLLIMELLQDAGIQEIIPPIKTINGYTADHIENFTLIVYPFVEGENGFSRNLKEDQWQKLGNIVRKVHEIDVPLAIQDQIRRESYSPKWREAVRRLYTHIESEAMTYASSLDEAALKLFNFMNENMPAIHRLVDRAEQLSQKLEEQSPKFVLCHSDIHAGNVLIDNNNSFYIVDWDDPIMAPKERDLMFIGGGVANVWNKKHEEESFYKGYGKTEINKTILAYYRHERIVEDIALYGQALLMTTAGGENRQVMLRQFIDMFKPEGVVDIAFRTDH